MGSQCSCLRRRLAPSALRDLRMSLAAEFCTCWRGLMIVCGQPASTELQKSNLDRMHELPRVLDASSLRYWPMELMRLISVYALFYMS